ncbi:hypothetical protein [Microbacterium suwonense]|uniref:Uncharacterized protein n=1 Tax=Microbacterium suwonense TaxID=683047 RepID=A0ABM8FVB2_9MICO|nr:hypothetical protein [Microbacterium suwonense]BDZ39589.1 hypothetical protein GCM10025863_22030 [Microbacterium suwonense]
MAGEGIQLDAETADRQIELLLESQEMLESSSETMVKLAEGQTALLWTADGKCVDLTDELKARYDAARLWLEEISKDVVEARLNLQKAIDETNLLAEMEKERFRALLFKAVGVISPTGPIAI